MGDSRILVVGGAGYVGSVLVHELVERGYAVRVLDRLYFGEEGLADVRDRSAAGAEKMKENKPLTPGPAAPGQSRGGSTEDTNGARGASEQRPRRSGAMEPLPPRPRSIMQTEAHQTTRKPRGRLSRDVQSKLGKVLQNYFDDVVKQGVPDRFTELLRQYDERKDKGSS